MSNERKPLLSDEAVAHLSIKCDESFEAFTRIRDFYEAKVTSGELRVVKEVEAIDQPLEEAGGIWYLRCSLCSTNFKVWENTNFCPGCGNKIKK